MNFRAPASVSVSTVPYREELEEGEKENRKGEVRRGLILKSPRGKKDRGWR